MVKQDKGQSNNGRERALALLKIWEDEFKMKYEINDGDLKLLEKSDSKVQQEKSK